MKKLHDRVDRLEEAQAAHRLYVAEQYVPKTDMSDFRREVRDGFEKISEGIERIYDKLDGKQDKKK